MTEPRYDEETGYWVGPEIPWQGPNPIIVELPDPTPEAGWPAEGRDRT